MKIIELSKEAKDAVERGSILEAVKILREKEGVGLKEAKDAVDAYLDRNPHLAQRIRRPATGCFIFMGVLVVAAALIAATLSR